MTLRSNNPRAHFAMDKGGNLIAIDVLEKFLNKNWPGVEIAREPETIPTPTPSLLTDIFTPPATPALEPEPSPRPLTGDPQDERKYGTGEKAPSDACGGDLAKHNDFRPFFDPHTIYTWDFDIGPKVDHWSVMSTEEITESFKKFKEATTQASEQVGILSDAIQSNPHIDCAQCGDRDFHGGVHYMPTCPLFGIGVSQNFKWFDGRIHLDANPHTGDETFKLTGDITDRFYDRHDPNFFDRPSRMTKSIADKLFEITYYFEYPEHFNKPGYLRIFQESRQVRVMKVQGGRIILMPTQVAMEQDGREEDQYFQYAKLLDKNGVTILTITDIKNFGCYGLTPLFWITPLWIDVDVTEPFPKARIRPHLKY